MNILRWVATALVGLGVLASGAFSTGRFMGAIRKARADDAYEMGNSGDAVDLYERALDWDPYALTAITDEADAVVAMLTDRSESLASNPALAPEMAGRALRFYVRAIAEAGPNSWSWAGIASVYDALHDYRPLLMPMDLSALAADPMENLDPEDRLAEAALLMALHFEPENYFYLDSLGELYWSRGLHTQALAPFREAVRIYPVVGSHFFMEDRLKESPQLVQAVQEGLDQARGQINARDRWIVFREQAKVARLTGDLDGAARFYKGALKRSRPASPTNRVALYSYLAEVQRSLGEKDAAVRNLREAITIQPHRPLLRSRLGQFLGELGRHEEAMAAFSVARALDPGNPHVFRSIASEAQRAGDLDQAEKAYRELIHLAPRQVEPYLSLIEMFRSNGFHARAIPYARQLVRLEPDDPLYQRQLEQLYDDEARQ